jgi:alginate O-acetyltransferase complex protein AlgI
MLFSSPRFFVFLFCVLAALRLPLSVPRKKNLLAVASCLFYAAWDFRYLALLLAVSVIDYACAARIAATTSDPRRRAWLAASVVSNLGILGYFKYANFFVTNVDALFGAHIEPLDVLLPAGISFYTFKSMSYTIDVYRREIEPCESHLDYATFVTFFPELIAGPIVRASVFLPQMGRDIGPSPDRLRSGGSLFLLGITKKLLLADTVAAFVDPAFAKPELYSCGSLWCAVVAYAIQIYADFSGYSDMAIGTAKMLGYDLPENFNMPYVSRSPTEFWRRWHMTLSSWLRDYLYIPLGGNRRSPARTYANLAATMLLGGLWHGASWNFVLWGALHGAALAAHKLARAVRPAPLPPPLAWALTLTFAVLCWIPFRAPTIGATWTILSRLVRPGVAGVLFYPSPLAWVTGVVVLGHLVGLAVERTRVDPEWKARVARALDALGAEVELDRLTGSFVRLGTQRAGLFVVALWVLVVFFFSAVTASPFIYFQF